MVTKMFDGNEGFYSRLRILRENSHLKPSDLCKISGVKPSVYALYERGIRAPSLEPLRLLLKNQCLKDRVIWLILGRDEELDYEFSMRFFPYALARSAMNLPNLIQAWVHFNKYEVADAAKVLNVSENTLNGVMYGYRMSPQYKTILKLMANKEMLAIIVFYLTGYIRTVGDVLVMGAGSGSEVV